MKAHAVCLIVKAMCFIVNLMCLSVKIGGLACAWA